MTENLAYDKSRELLKDATSQKDVDINTAILLINEAIEICPEKILSDYFKLANYYHLACKKEEAYDLLQKTINDLDANEIGMYNMNKSSVYDKICTLNYKDNLFNLYLHNYSMWYYNTTLAFACQGRRMELKNIVDATNKLGYLAPTKVNCSFKKLNKLSIKDQFNDRLNNFISSLSNTLTEMANKAYNFRFPFESESIIIGETSGQREDRLLSKDNSFVTSYRQLNSNDFNYFYDIQLKPLLE